MGRFFTQKRDGRVKSRLGEGEVAVLRSALAGFRALLVAGDEPIAYRLRPPAYPQDADAEQEYQATTADDLLRGRLEGIDRVDRSLGADQLDEDDLTAWLTTWNALRLVLGTRLGVTEDDTEPVAEDHEDAPVWALYHFLSALLWETVEILQGRLDR